MDLAALYKDLRIEECNDFIGIKTAAAQEHFKKACGRWNTRTEYLKQVSGRIASLRERLTPALREQLGECFTIAAEEEATVEKVLNPPSEFSEECYGQLLFRGDLTGTANYIPFLLTVLRFYKIFITPAMAVAMPLMALILPYLIVRYVFKVPIPLHTYTGMLKSMYGGGGGSPANPLMSLMPAAKGASVHEGGIFEKLKFYAQTGWLLFNVFQSCWQPIQSARHLYKLDETLTAQGNSIQRLIGATYKVRDILTGIGFKSARLSVVPDDVADQRQAVAYALESPNLFRFVMRQLGEYEVLYRLAAHKDICIVHWIKGESPTKANSGKGAEPYLHLYKSFDIRVADQDRVPITVKLTGNCATHALLTGPNRGGKSTALRAIGRSVFLAHIFGVSIGQYAKMTTFSWIKSCLRLEDIPGEKSLFEREVGFSGAVLRTIRSEPRGLLLIDELFHSTNPPDAEIASREFLGELWKSKSVSVISTHVFSLTEKASEKVKLLCCPATTGEGGKVDYKYGLAPGICKVSSVREILEENWPAPVAANK
jgi:hypothetical protein